MFKQKEIAVILSIVVGLSFLQSAFSFGTGADRSGILDVNYRKLMLIMQIIILYKFRQNE